MTKFEHHSKPIRELVQNPDTDQISKTLNQATDGIHQVAPNIGQSLQTVSTRALTYLHGKLPKPASELIGDEEYEPSKTDQRSWLQQHQIVSDPVSALDHVKNGTLTSDHMDALQQVHPELLQEMQKKVMENMDPKAVRGLPSSTKRSLQTFLGQPVNAANTPATIQSNQAIFQQQAMPQAGGNKSTQSGLEKLAFGQRAATETVDTEQDQD